MIVDIGNLNEFEYNNPIVINTNLCINILLSDFFRGKSFFEWKVMRGYRSIPSKPKMGQSCHSGLKYPTKFPSLVDAILTFIFK